MLGRTNIFGKGTPGDAADILCVTVDVLLGDSLTQGLEALASKAIQLYFRHMACEVLMDYDESFSINKLASALGYPGIDKYNNDFSVMQLLLSSMPMAYNDSEIVEMFGTPATMGLDAERIREVITNVREWVISETLKLEE